MRHYRLERDNREMVLKADYGGEEMKREFERNCELFFSSRKKFPLIKLDMETSDYLRKWEVDFESKRKAVRYESAWSDFDIELDEGEGNKIWIQIREVISDDKGVDGAWNLIFFMRLKEKYDGHTGDEIDQVCFINLLGDTYGSMVYPFYQDDYLKNGAGPMICLIHNLLLFVAFYEPEVKEYVEKERKTVYGKKGKKVETNSTVNLRRYVSDLNSHAKRLPHRKCPYSFGVRGHYRHYKSGKVIFIKAFEKNKGKPSKQTVYKIGGLNEQG